MKRLFLCFVLVAWVLTLSACTAEREPIPTPTAVPVPRTVTVLAGAGTDTTAILAFFPEVLRVGVGDTVAWKLEGGEPHTVSFLSGAPSPEVNVPVPGGAPAERMQNPQRVFPTRGPGAPVEAYDGTGFLSSGRMSLPGEPVNDTFSLTFTKPGVFRYLCLVHNAPMEGTIVVESAAAMDLPDQPQIDAQAKAEMAALLAQVDLARERGKALRSEPGPNNTAFWFVRAGAIESQGGNVRAEAFDFLPKDLTIKTGDTVVWGSILFHTVTFNPVPPPPEAVIPKPQPEGLPLRILNPRVNRPAKPAAVFDPAQYFNSAPIGRFGPQGPTWALTFETPGTFKYFCAVHRELGMEASITVIPR